MRFLITATALSILGFGGSATAQTYGTYTEQHSSQQLPAQASPFGASNEAYRAQSGFYGQQMNPYGNQQSAPPSPRQYEERAPTTQPGAYRQDDQRRQDRVARDNLAVDVEAALHARGYDVGVVDGLVDTQSRAAIRAYERSAGLASTGEPSQALLAHIETNQLRADNIPSQTETLGTAAGQVMDRFLNQGR